MTEVKINASQKKRSMPLVAYAFFYLGFLYVPVLFLPLFSFNDSMYISFPLRGFTFDWYKEMLTNEAMHGALVNSLKVGIFVSTFSTILGIFGAKAVTKYRMRGKKTVLGLIMLPLVIPEIIIAVALLIFILQAGGKLSLYSIALGHTLLCVPFAMAVLISRFEGFDRAMEEASADLGENGWWTFWRVTFPIVLPGVAASLLLCFTISFDEFIIAFFLGGTEPTLPVYMWNQLRFPKLLPGVLALGACIFFISFLVIGFAEWLRQRNDHLVTRNRSNPVIGREITTGS